jgi:hypothetical protein
MYIAGDTKPKHIRDKFLIHVLPFTLRRLPALFNDPSLLKGKRLPRIRVLAHQKEELGYNLYIVHRILYPICCIR